MSQVLPIRPGLLVAGGGRAPRVHVVLEPGTPPEVVAAAGETGRFDMSVDQTGVAGLAVTRPPAKADALVVEVDPAEPDFAAFAAVVRDLAGTMPVIAAVRDLTVGATRQVLRAGAADVLPLPFSADELATVTAHLQPPALARVAAAAAPARQGKIVSVLGALGGCGATTVAVQSGLQWAGRASVCLLDLDVQFGAAALYLNINPELCLTDVLDADDRLDAELLQTVAARHPSGLHVVASPPEMSPLDLLSPEAVQKLLGLARQVFDVVIVDLPRAWLEWTVSALQLSDSVLLVAPLSVPGIHQARRQLEVLEANGLLDKTRVVLNRVATPLFGKVDLRETQGLLGRRIDFTIGNDYPTVSTAIDEGKAFSGVKSRSRVEKDVRALVTALTETLAKAEAL